MTTKFKNEVLKIVVAQICQVVGFQSVYAVPMEVLMDVMERYILKIAVSTKNYAEHCGRTIPCMADLSLAFKDNGIKLSDLQEYVNQVDPFPFPHEIPKLPIARPSNMNFLKPGSKETLSRPIHIHEHLPPMYPEKEEEDTNLTTNDSFDDEQLCGLQSPLPSYNDRMFGDVDEHSSKRQKYSHEEEGEPVREIDSVMMTTSGFISSARAGKLPETRKPNIGLPSVQRDSSSLKKKATLEKIIKHKNIFGVIQQGHLPKPQTKEAKLKPKLPSVPPGTGSLKTGKVAPILKMPTPKKIEETAGKEIVERRRRDEHRHRDRRRDRDRSRDEKYRGRMRMRGLSKEEELRRYKQREQELIAALAASASVTVTSIPPPRLRVREKTPDKSLPLKNSPGKESVDDDDNKLAIFKKLKMNELPETPESPSSLIDVQNIKEEKIDEDEYKPASSFYVGFDTKPINTSLPETPGKTILEKELEQLKKSKPKIKSPCRRHSKLSRKRKNSTIISEKVADLSVEPADIPNIKSPTAEYLVYPNAPSHIPSFSSFSYDTFGQTPPDIKPLINVYPESSLNSTLTMNESVLSSHQDSEDFDRSLENASSYMEEVQQPLQTVAASLPKLEKKRERKKEKKSKDAEKEKVKRKKKDKERAREEKKKEKERLKEEKRRKKKEKEEGCTIPKITLKLQTDEPQSSQTMDSKPTPKLVIKPVLKRPHESSEKRSHYTSFSAKSVEEPGSPEIAKLTALIPRPSKSSSKKHSESQIVPPVKITGLVKKSEKKKRKHLTDTPPTPRIVSPPHRTFSPPSSPQASMRKPSKKESGSTTAIVTETVGPVGFFKDDKGNDVWICPACMKQDDGSPMIGCDTCDDWYHWVCIGIQVAPSENVNWYCNRCIMHQRSGTEKKKRGRKRKVI